MLKPDRILRVTHKKSVWRSNYKKLWKWICKKIFSRKTGAPVCLSDHQNYLGIKAGKSLYRGKRMVLLVQFSLNCSIGCCFMEKYFYISTSTEPIVSWWLPSTFPCIWPLSTIKRRVDMGTLEVLSHLIPLNRFPRLKYVPKAGPFKRQDNI